MNVSATFFRFRRWILLLIFLLGFWAPLDRMGGARPGNTWLFLAGALAHNGLLPIAYSSTAVMGVAILLALFAAMLRTWAAAYLGHGVIRDSVLHGEQLLADGPYRYGRNPLYVGLWLHTLALAILMPPGGALFAVLAVAIVSVLCIHAEERHLAAEQGAAYLAYKQKVPRFVLALTPRVPAGGAQARWGAGFLGEIYMWGAVITYAAFANRYNVTILEQGILISLGIAVVVQGLWRPVVPARA